MRWMTSPFFDKAPFPSFFVGERRQDLGRDRILLIQRQRDDFFRRLLQEVTTYLNLNLTLSAALST